MELLIVFIYASIVLLIAYFYQNRKIREGKPEYIYFFKGMFFKIVGSQAFALVYTYYYGYGDTFEYFTCIEKFHDFFWEYPDEGIMLLTSTAKYLKEINYEINYGHSIYVLPGGREMPFFYSSDFLLLTKLLFFIYIPAFKSYFVLNLLFAVLSFSGLWKLFLVFSRLHPKNTKYFAYAIFYVPSIFFWGSGLMKDSITIGCVGWIVYCVYCLFVERSSNKMRYILMFAVCFYLVFVLKAYIILSLFPAILIWLYLRFQHKIKNAFFKLVVSPVLFALIFGLAIYGIATISAQSDKYKLDNIVSTAQGYQSWHTTLANAEGGGGSFYTLGDVEYTPIGVLKKIPAALSVTFFRPFIWEIRSPIIAISSIESLFVFCFTIYALFKIKFVPLLNIILKTPESVFCLIFSLILGFSVGFTSYNFGALVRYKIPCLMFYLINLIIIMNIYNKEESAQKKSG